MLSQILYGTASLTHGGLKFIARAAGKRGEQVSLTISAAAHLLVTVSNKREGAGDIAVSAPAGTTDQELINALGGSLDFKRLASVEQIGGDGSDLVTPLAKANFVAAGGLQQHLQSRLGIANWESRTLIATGAAVGDIWTSEATLERSHPYDDNDYWSGKLHVGVACTLNQGYEVQNEELDWYRRRLVYAMKVFDHDDLREIGPVTCGYTNMGKDEAAGTALQGGRLGLVAHCVIHWQEPSLDSEDLAEVPLDQINVGLFREPEETSVQITDDGEVKDQDLSITP